MATKTNQKKQSRNKFTVLTDVMAFPVDRAAMKEELKKRIVFDAPVLGTLPKKDDEKPISFHRISMGIVNSDGSEGNIILGLDRSFSFGVGENKQNDKLNGYSLSVSMYNQEGATPRQSRSVTFIECLSELAKEHLLSAETKEKTELYELTEGELKKVNPLWYKKEKGKIVEGASPALYPKLLWWAAGKNKKGEDQPARFGSTFYLEDEYDELGNLKTAEPLEFLNTRMNVTPAVRFEGLFLGSTVKSMQVKLYEVDVKPIEQGRKRLLKSSLPLPDTSFLTATNPNSVAASSSSSDAVQDAVVKDDPRLVASDDEEEEVKVKPKVVKVRVKKETK